MRNSIANKIKGKWYEYENQSKRKDSERMSRIAKSRKPRFFYYFSGHLLGNIKSTQKTFIDVKKMYAVKIKRIK